VKREKLGQRLKRVRIARGFGLRQTAAKVGISATYLSRIENCQETGPPAEKVISALSRLLDESFDELMQLAGRVPEDVEEVIKADPGMATLLRTARQRRVSGAELLRLLDKHKAGK
jgi:transcriptional regulator with XRE-family HTH domain